MLFKKKIVVTGGSGRFAQSLKKIKSKYKFIYPQKKSLDITKVKSIKNFLKKQKPESVLHLAGLSRPMSIHDKNIKKSSSYSRLKKTKKNAQLRAFIKILNNEFRI